MEGGTLCSFAFLDHQIMQARSLASERISPAPKPTALPVRACWPMEVSRPEMGSKQESSTIKQQIHLTKIKTMNALRIAVIIGSTRPGRNGEAVAKWVHEIAKAYRRRVRTRGHQR